MTRPDELVSILDRILDGCGDEGDVAILRQFLKESSGQNVVQLGKYNINIGEGQDIHIGDKVYQGADAQTIRSIFLEVLSQNTRQLEIDWHNISQAMLSEQQRLTTNPLTSGEGITYRTEQVYVPLGLVERKKPTRRREDVSPEQGSELYRETEITQTFEHQQFLEQVLRHRQSPKSQGRRIAIIGEPGAGKTTLLQQIAQWVSLEMAQSVVIWVSLADLRTRELESYLLEVWLQAVARKVGQAEASTQVQDNFVAQFNQGLVWLLLDGVDEMQATVGNPLGEIERQIRTGTLLQQARIVLSCRLNLWDGGSNALDSFDNYRTLEFCYPQQVEQFIGNWFGSLPLAETQTGQQLCAALRESAKERIRDLVKNPLRLTLLCFNWYLGEGKLPETKAGLYEQFVADFYEWKKGQFATTGEQRKGLNAALGELAREAIDKEATRFRLRQEFVCEYLGEPDDADSLFGLALRLGWLNKVGVDGDNPRKGVYAFFHPTFQEYFAALAIDDWHYFLNHIPENPSHVDANYRIFEVYWRETIVLWLGWKTISKNSKEELIHELVHFKDNCGNFYRIQAYLLAAVGISEFSVSKGYVDVILDKLITVGFGTLDEASKETKIFPNSISQSARNVLAKSYHPSTTSKLLQLLQKNKNEENQEKIAKIVLSLCPGNQTALLYLINVFNTTKNRNTIQSLLKDFREVDLGELKSEVEKTLEYLLYYYLEVDFIGYLKSEELPTYFRCNKLDIYLFLDVITTLNSIQFFFKISKTLLESFFEFDILDDNIQCLLAEQLLEIDTEHPLANKVLRTIYQSSHDDDARFWAVLCLSKNDSDKISYLNELIDNTKDIDTAIDIAETLLKIDHINIKALNFMTGLLDTTYGFYCFYSAEILLKNNLERQKAIDALFDLLKSDEIGTRRYAAEALGNLYVDCKDAVDVLLKDLSFQGEEIRSFPFAETCLGNLKLERLLAAVVVKLKECLHQSSGYVNRGACYDSLWNYASKTPYPVFYNAWNSKC
ncbi:NACHT domain-containing protein [Scytonema hofmannii FACHB-248]|uniref:NACHT domain-containing protein n=1 Tax=Scytonema hofmannii FACHB-248 TaxID=1842502 RepID=A0ABR8GVJ3_9CYAN|nr:MULTISPECIES: NACHT domain-containing protein [Nostocales]MBD2607398.1 NACHT domain-containing protein [Scytonema hofmannii FACHB-248]